jgi:sugar phosphate isomerase/epimerase
VFTRAIVTDEVSQDPADAIGLARRFRLDTIEVRTAWEKRPHELTGDDIRALRGMIRDAGLTVCAVATPVFKCALDNPGEGREHLEILKRCLAVCHELETRLARVFTFWRPCAPGAPDLTEGALSWAEAAPRISARLREAAGIARDAGCRLVVENEPSVYGSSCAQVAEILSRADHTALGALWDPGNAIYDLAVEPPYPDGYETLRRFISHIHLKDARRDPRTHAASAVALGDGEIPYPAILRRLRDDGYEGVVSLETHYRVGAVLSEEAARMPSGSAFSAGGFQASVICLERWDAMMAELRLSP